MKELAPDLPVPINPPKGLPMNIEVPNPGAPELHVTTITANGHTLLLLRHDGTNEGADRLESIAEQLATMHQTQVIVLAPDDQIATLDEQEMLEAGWAKVPGVHGVKA